MPKKASTEVFPDETIQQQDQALNAPSRGLNRGEAESALRQLSRLAIDVLTQALERGDARVAQWVLEHAVIRLRKADDAEEKSARMKDEEARAELIRRIDGLAAQAGATEADSGPDAGSG